jgi:peptide chain release factor subunit 3
METLIRKNNINIIFIGHVDSGKSTIGGHILYLTGQVDKRTLDKYQREAKDKNRESWYLSWALDTNVEERDRGKTVEVGRAFFETDSTRFTILDAPGHKSFVPNMIGGASQADVAVLVISARKGEFETGFERGGQTREHAMLVKTSGIEHLIVVVNKMDDPTVGWDKSRFQEIQNKLSPYLKTLDFSNVMYIPISGLTGTNLIDVSSDIWYDGPSLVAYLDSITLHMSRSNGPVRLSIVGRYNSMGTTIFGKLGSGTIVKGQTLIIMPNKISVQVLEMFSGDDEVERSCCGDNINVKLKDIVDDDISPGFVLCSPDDICHTSDCFDAQILIVECKSIICAGYSAVLHIHNCIEDVLVDAIICLIDRKTNIKSRRTHLKPGDIAIVRLQICSGIICIETYKDFSHMARFILRNDCQTVAVGKVLKLK